MDQEPNPHKQSFDLQNLVFQTRSTALQKDDSQWMGFFIADWNFNLESLKFDQHARFRVLKGNFDISG